MAFFLLPYIKLFKKTNRITAHSRKSPYLGPPWIVSINYWYILIVYATVHYTTVQYTTIPRSAQSRVKKKSEMQNIGFQEKTSSDKRCSSCELLGTTLGILTRNLYKSPTNIFGKDQSYLQTQFKPV